MLVVASHNWFYGMPFPQKLGDSVQMIHYLVGFMGIFVVWSGAQDFSFFLINNQKPAITWSSLYFISSFFVVAICFPLSEFYDRSFRKKINASHINLTRMSFRDQQAQGGFFPLGIPFNQCYDLEIREVQLKWHGLNPLDSKLRILHVSDLHMGGLRDQGYFSLVMEKAAALKPDLLALTGDIVDGHKCAGWIGPVFGKIKPRFGKVAVLGNHDLWNDPDLVKKCLKRTGFKILHDQCHSFDFHGLPISILGCGYPWFNEQLPAVSQKTGSGFRIFLSHSPDQVYWANQNKFDLMLSGHVHGGQIVCPGIGPILVPSKYGRRFAGGIYQVGETILNVSKGIGGSQPVRFFCPPEITLLNCSFEE